MILADILRNQKYPLLSQRRRLLFGQTDSVIVTFVCLFDLDEIGPVRENELIFGVSVTPT